MSAPDTHIHGRTPNRIADVPRTGKHEHFCNNPKCSRKRHYWQHLTDRCYLQYDASCPSALGKVYVQ